MTQKLKDKKRRVFEEINMEFTAPVYGDVVENFNAVIKRHNNECEAFETKAEETRDRLAKDIISRNIEKFTELREATDQAKKNEQTNEQQWRHLKAEIDGLEAKIIEHRRPAEELNVDLQKYLGHDELRLEIREIGYIITRNDVPVQTLSEGETTAVALLYFLKSLQDRQFNLKHGIVVLDDPVSSLDANALFRAYGFIRERVRNIGQVFILTHNFTFFRQIQRGWFKYLGKDAELFMLDSAQEGNVRTSTIQCLDPLLANYESEYHYLFSRIYKAANALEPKDLEGNYVLPNLATRMLESFLSFRYPRDAGNLRRMMKEVSFEEAKKYQIIRFLHTHSHSFTMDEPEHDITKLAEGPSVLRNLLEMIQLEDKKHFEAMVACISE